MFKVIRVLPIPQIDKNLKTTRYAYQAYVSDGKQTYVTEPKDSLGQAKREGRQLATLHNERKT